jgi:hypothetical protein
MKNLFRQSIFALMATMALGVGFSACNSDDVPAKNTSADGSSGNGSYFVMNISFPLSGTSTRDAETSYDYVVGNSNEYNVECVYLYFFDANTQEAVTLSNGQHYLKCPVSYVKNKDNVYESYNQTVKLGVTYTTGLVEFDSNLEMDNDYDVYLTCNYPVSGDCEDLSEFLDSQKDFPSIQSEDNYRENLLPMSSRSAGGNLYEQFTVLGKYNAKSPLELTFYVERDLARIVYTNDDTVFDLYESVEDDGSDPIGTVELCNKIIVNTYDTWYTFRHVGTMTRNNDKITATFAPFRYRYGAITSSYPYVIDPYSEKKTPNGEPRFWSDYSIPGHLAPAIYFYSWDLGYYSIKLANYGGLEIDNTLEPASSAIPFVMGYVAENVCHQDAQTMSNTTGVMFRAKITPYIIYKSTGATTKDVSSFYYFNGKFYDSKDALAALFNLTDEDITDFLEKGDIKYYKNGYGYYIYFIEHEGAPDKMAYAVVRNNSYELNIVRVAMAPYTDDELLDLNYEDPVGKKAPCLETEIVVRPWILRPQSTDLGDE